MDLERNGHVLEVFRGEGNSAEQEIGVGDEGNRGALRRQFMARAMLSYAIPSCSVRGIARRCVGWQRGQRWSEWARWEKEWGSRDSYPSGAPVYGGRRARHEWRGRRGGIGQEGRCQAFVWGEGGYHRQGLGLRLAAVWSERGRWSAGIGRQGRHAGQVLETKRRDRGSPGHSRGSGGAAGARRGQEEVEATDSVERVVVGCLPTKCSIKCPNEKRKEIKARAGEGRWSKHPGGVWVSNACLRPGFGRRGVLN